MYMYIIYIYIYVYIYIYMALFIFYLFKQYIDLSGGINDRHSFGAEAPKPRRRILATNIT